MLQPSWNLYGSVGPHGTGLAGWNLHLSRMLSLGLAWGRRLHRARRWREPRSLRWRLSRRFGGLSFGRRRGVTGSLGLARGLGLRALGLSPRGLCRDRARLALALPRGHGRCWSLQSRLGFPCSCE